MKKLIAVVRAAGEAKRMRSSRPKVLHPVCGRPLIAYPVAVCRALGARVVVVVGRAADEVRVALGEADDLTFVEQKDRLGTGEAGLPTAEGRGGGGGGGPRGPRGQRA